MNILRIERPISSKRKLYYVGLEIAFKDFTRRSFRLGDGETARFTADARHLGLEWSEGSTRRKIRIGIDSEGFLLGLDGKRVRNEKGFINISARNNNGCTFINFFELAFGLDGSIINTKKTCRDPVVFMERFHSWAKHPSNNFPQALEIKIDQSGCILLPLGERVVSITNDILRGSYRGKAAILVPLNILGKPFICLFDSKTYVYLGEREYDPQARAFFFSDPIRCPNRRYYTVVLAGDSSLTLGKQTVFIGSSRRKVGEVVRVVTDETKSILFVSSLANNKPLAVSGTDGKGRPTIIGCSSEGEHLMRAGKGVGSAIIKEYPRNKEDNTLGIMVARRKICFTKEDLEKYPEEIAESKEIQFCHEGRIVTDFMVGKARVPLVLNSQVTPEGIKLEKSYRANVLESDLNGLRLLEGARLVPLARDQRVYRGYSYFLIMPRPPFVIPTSPISILTLDGGPAIFFRDTLRLSKTDRDLVLLIAARLSGRRFRNPDSGLYSQYLSEAESLAKRSAANFLSLDFLKEAEARFLSAFQLYPGNWAPLKHAMRLRKVIILRGQYLKHRGRLGPKIKGLLSGNTPEGMVKLKQFIMGGQTNALILAHMLEIMAGIYSGKYPGEKEKCAQLLAALPLLFVINAQEFRYKLVKALKILQGEESTQGIVATVLALMPESLKKVRRLISFHGLSDGFTPFAVTPPTSLETQRIITALLEESSKCPRQNKRHFKYAAPTSQICYGISKRLERLSGKIHPPKWDDIHGRDLLMRIERLIRDYKNLQYQLTQGTISPSDAWQALAGLYSLITTNQEIIEHYFKIYYGSIIDRLRAEFNQMYREGIFEIQDILLRG